LKASKSEPTTSPQTPTQDSRKQPATCELCSRDQPLTFHHLIPRKTHGRRRFQRRYTKHEMRNRGLYVCRPCHSGIHDLIPDEVTLGERFNTKEQLLAHEGVARHVAWVARQK